MSKKKRPNSATPQPRRETPAPAVSYALRNVTSPRATLSPLLFSAGVIFLLVGGVASLLLVLDHLGGLHLPGCGEGSPCAEAANSKWGKIPLGEGFAWPVSFLGLAYFLGALGAWLASYRGVSPLFAQVARLSAAVSLAFVGVIIFGGYHCSYCIAAHLGNFAFWVVMERSRRQRPQPSLRPVGVFVAVWLAASGVMLGAEFSTRRTVTAKQEKELAESTADIIAVTTQRAATTVPEAGTGTTQATFIDDTQPASADRPWQGGFRGRYLYGPEIAPVRLVMLTDYQCVDCNRIEDEVRQMLRQRTDVSLSIKHFPMCTECNRHFSRNMHPNACWAARAAEAAGILYGNDGFWKMHFWLFDQDGGFTDAQLKQGLRDLGFDEAEFIRVMTGPETLARVQADIEEGIWLGLHFTPMVFINGVELKGVFAAQAVPRAVAAVAATNPPPMNHDQDQPPPAVDKYVSDWREGYAVTLPADSRPWPRGPNDARVKIVMWADYHEPYSEQADRQIRRWMADKPDVQYLFRHFPFNQECNSSVSRTAHPLACRASQAAEAAGSLGGVTAYLRMHDWLMDNPSDFNDDNLRRTAVALGLDADALFTAMASPEVKAAIEEDGRAGKSLLYRGGIPTIYVNGKVIPRWRLEGCDVLGMILDEAYRGGPAERGR